MILATLALAAAAPATPQMCGAITTVELVEIKPGMTREARAYYEAGWAAARKVAAKRGQIASYELLVSEGGVGTEPEVVLITTYADRAQYEAREEHFRAIFDEIGLDGPIVVEGKSRGEILGTTIGSDDYRSVYASSGDCGVPGHN